jgi:hypothetical protein
MIVHPFPLSTLALPAITILIAGFTISICFTRRPVLSCSVAALKAGLFLLYFGAFFDGTYTFLDDWRYLRVGELLASQHIGILNFVHHYQYVLSTVESVNLSYYIYNASSIELFGAGYYAPVASNILLTFVAAGLLTKTARAGLGMSQRMTPGLFAFLTLGPSILAWSTVTNMKDILVATATAGVVYAVALVDSGKLWRAVCFAIVGGFILMLTRFYVPLTLGAAFGIALLFSRRARRSPWLWLLAVAALAEVVHVLGHNSLTGALHSLRANAGNPITGIVRFVITPIPFHTAPGYGFLDLPQVIYWLLLPFEVYGLVTVWKKRTLTGRFLVIYFLVMTALYGVLTSLQGPRHRIQIDGLIVIFQYYGILALIKQRFRLTLPREANPAHRANPRRRHGEGHHGVFPQPEKGA